MEQKKSQAELDWEAALAYQKLKRARAQVRRSRRVYALTKVLLAGAVMYFLYALYTFAT